MSYTYPANTELDVTFAGDAAYVYPSASAIDVTWAVGTPTASGFMATCFGVPSIPLNAQGFSALAGFGTPVGKAVFRASGFKVGEFGEPRGPGYYQAVSGGPFAVFGVPAGPHNTQASGHLATAFGVPAGPHNTAAASLGAVTHFSVPSLQFKVESFRPVKFGVAQASYAQTCAAIGWIATKIPDGALASFSQVQDLGQTAQAHGWGAVQFGEASASWAQDGEAAGFMVPVFGQPSSMQVCVASGFQLTAFGTPRHDTQARASGFRVIGFGQPVAVVGHRASGFKLKVKFGTPRQTFPCGHRAYGLYTPARFGAPRLTGGVIHKAHGLNSAARFGQPRTGCHL